MSSFTLTAPCSTKPEAEQSGFAFPQPLTEKYRPRYLADFVGLEKPRKVLGNFAANPKPMVWLFVGGSGLGKTTMALALADEIRAEVHHIPSQKCNVENVESTTHKCWFLPVLWQSGKPMESARFHLVLVDEADQMSTAAQLAFLSKLDASARPPNTVFIFTCNDTERFEKRFLSRCCELEFSSYGLNGAGAEFLRKVWEAEAPEGTPAPDLARLMKNSSNNLRDALMCLEVELLSA